MDKDDGTAKRRSRAEPTPLSVIWEPPIREPAELRGIGTVLVELARRGQSDLVRQIADDLELACGDFAGQVNALDLDELRRVLA
jgi:hypothetical protein